MPISHVRMLLGFGHSRECAERIDVEGWPDEDEAADPADTGCWCGLVPAGAFADLYEDDEDDTPTPGAPSPEGAPHG